tara:strand:+ start:334 stop:714 length:381 start_codon:yes stop_codon:yes gene_type:complete
MKNLVYLLILLLAPMASTNAKEIGPITLECENKASILTENASVALIEINPQKNEVKVGDQILRIATISEGFVTWIQESDLAFQFFVWNDFNKQMHSWFTRPWDDYMTGRWNRRGTHVPWTCRPVNA